MRGINCRTDHQMMVKSGFQNTKKHNRQGTSKPTKLNTAKVSTFIHMESLEQEIDSALAQWQ
ncbi:hypothetical protein LSH36_1145g00005 [Paralvinella palmiformis]|uniref:Uncharacterized protein n=1 Tax=Paralvinella palmiformis TaxID=53620 RepID=A0AAD9IVT1_9ANNE|nr:hypothetical protein LSH36_1145g00005 [Paralvinella palmiformis]